MTDALAAIKAQIKRKRAALSTLKQQEKELERLKTEVATIPRVQADVSALERSLAILQGEEPPEVPTEPETPRRKKEQVPSIPSIAYSILKETGKPMTGDEIYSAFLARDKKVSKASLLGALYRNVKRKHLFRLVSSGTFGLLEGPEPARRE